MKVKITLDEYLKDIKYTLAYQVMTEDEKARWDITVNWLKSRARGTNEQQMREIGAAYFAFIEGIGGTQKLIDRRGNKNGKLN